MNNEWNKYNLFRAVPKKKKKGQKKKYFNPDRKYIEKAKEVFFKAGGKIMKIEGDQIAKSDGISCIFGDDTYQFFTSQF